MALAPESRPTPPPADSREEADAALHEVLEHQAVQARRLAALEARTARGGVSRYLVLFLSLLLAYLWLGDPAWLRPAAPAGPGIAEQTAAARLALYLQSQRIEVFHIENGRLPANLAEAGEP